MATILIVSIFFFNASYLVNEEIAKFLQQDYYPSRGVVKLGMTPNKADGMKQWGH